MPRQLTQLANGEIYHIVLRAVGDSVIFKNEDDYYRGIFSIYEFNNKNFVTIRARRQKRKKEKANFYPQSLQVSETRQINRSRRPVNSVDVRDKLVEILAFAFMPNHVHLLVKQLKNEGITKFMQKFGGGYANYFNKKFERKGHLFNQFRAIYIKTNEQLKNVFVYIHTNPVSLIEPGFKEKGVENIGETIKFLENYKWHSYLDYIGKKNFTSVTVRDFILEIMGGENGCKEAVEDWIKYKKEMRDFGDIVLE